MHLRQTCLEVGATCGEGRSGKSGTRTWGYLQHTKVHTIVLRSYRRLIAMSTSVPNPMGRGQVDGEVILAEGK